MVPLSSTISSLLQERSLSVGMFFRSNDGEIYVAFASSAGLDVCSLKSDIPNFIDVPTSCQYIAKLSPFDPVSVLVECIYFRKE